MGSVTFGRLRDLDAAAPVHDQYRVHPLELAADDASRQRILSREADVFSVSIHGCDHVAAEFGAASRDISTTSTSGADADARTSERHGIEHDPVMVFPQGVFSLECRRC